MRPRSRGKQERETETDFDRVGHSTAGRDQKVVKQSERIAENRFQAQFAPCIYASFRAPSTAGKQIASRRDSIILFIFFAFFFILSVPSFCSVATVSTNHVNFILFGINYVLMFYFPYKITILYRARACVCVRNIN